MLQIKLSRSCACLPPRVREKKTRECKLSHLWEASLDPPLIDH